MQYMYTVYTLKATINIDNILCTRIYHSICFGSVRVVACMSVCVCVCVCVYVCLT